MQPIFAGWMRRISTFRHAFYETGGVRKNKLSDTDVNIIVDLLNEVKPHQVYAAGDLADPHGTHRVCLDAIFMAFEKQSRKNGGKTVTCGCIVEHGMNGP